MCDGNFTYQAAVGIPGCAPQPSVVIYPVTTALQINTYWPYLNTGCASPTTTLNVRIP